MTLRLRPLHSRAVFAMLLAILAAIALIPGLAAAQPNADSTDIPDDKEAGPGNDTIVVDEYDLHGRLLSRNAYGRDGQAVDVPQGFRPQPAPKWELRSAQVPPRNDRSGGPGSVVIYGSGSGGSSSASGCATLTVMNEKETALGFTLFWFNTWTSWCWNRSSYLIYNFDTGWYLSDVDPVIEWQQMLVDHTGLYAYYPNQWSSGSYNDKQGWLKSCVLTYGCYANHYPYNQAWTTYEGTWFWNTED